MLEVCRCIRCSNVTGVAADVVHLLLVLEQHECLWNGERSAFKAAARFYVKLCKTQNSLDSRTDWCEHVTLRCVHEGPDWMPQPTVSSFTVACDDSPPML